MRVDVAWASIQEPGLEHAVLSTGSRGQRLAGDLMVVLDEQPLHISYRLKCDAAWRVTHFTASVRGPETSTRIALAADGEGTWTDELQGTPLPELDGCVDIDLTATPLTNTLPIRRLGLSSGAHRDLDVAYVEVPALTVRPVVQRYTRMARDGDGRDGDSAGAEARYRYESGAFRVDLPVDEYGLVGDYPEYWRRISLR